MQNAKNPKICDSVAKLTAHELNCALKRSQIENLIQSILNQNHTFIKHNNWFLLIPKTTE